MAGRTVRVGLRTDDPYLHEQVRRVVDAAGALLLGPGEDGADVVLVDDQGEGVATPGARCPEVRVRIGAKRPPVASLVPGGDLELPADAEPLLRYLSGLAVRPRARVVGVVGVRGGVGASTIAAALARSAVTAGVCTALVELHSVSGGLDILLGAEHEPGPRWPDLRAERGGFPAEALALALPRWEAVRVLSGDRRGGPEPSDPGVPDALRALASSHDVVVLDLPRAGWWGVVGPGPGAGQSPQAPAVACDVVVLVAACDVRSAAAAGVLAHRLDGADARLVVRRGPGDGLHPDEVAEAGGLPVAAVLPTVRGAAAAADRGEAPGDRRRGPLARTAGRLVAALGLLP